MIRITFWTAVFLVILRVCIGWHFFFEGVSKVKSAYLGKSAANEKPFSSETYFRESESWLGRKLKPILLGDPDTELVAKISPEGEALSPTLESEWNAYFDSFKKTYKLNEDETKSAQKIFDDQKIKYVKWATGDGGIDKETNLPKKQTLTVKRKAPGNNPGGEFEEQVLVADRCNELLKKSAEVKAVYAKFIELGKDVDGANLRTLKGEVTAIHKELQKELDDQTKLLKDALAKVIDTKLSAYPPKVSNPEEEFTQINALLSPMTGDNNPLSKLWDEYGNFVKEFSPGITEEQKTEVDNRIKAAKTRYDRWLADQDLFTGEPAPRKEVAEWRALYADAEKRKDAAEQKLLIARIQADIKGQTDALKTEIGKSLGEDRSKGYATAETQYYFGFIPKWKPIEYMDWSTRWFLAVVGSMLMFGLFTRTSCFFAAGFLLMTNLIQPSVPWLPTAPNNEGNYLFVNKNMVEMFALLVLMTTRSGLWAGVDALIEFVFGRRNAA